MAMDKDEQRSLVLAGVGLLVVVLVLSKLKTTTTGYSGSTATLKEAWQQENTSEQEHNQYVLAMTQQANQSLIAYENIVAQTKLGTGALSVQSESDRLQAKTSVDLANIQANAQTQAAAIQVQAAKYQADAVEKAAEIAAQSATAQAQAQAQAQAAIANSQKDASEAASHATQQAGLWNGILSLVGGLFGL